MRRTGLIIGASGQLGTDLCRVLRGEWELAKSGNRRVRPGWLKIDLSDPAGTVAAIREARPQYLFIAGALTNVELCEAQPETCFRINVEGPRAVAEYARDHGATVVYYSTDHVFDGGQERNVESDPPRPLNVYARSKVRGEQMIRELLPDRHLIIRTAWLYGPDLAYRNFILRLAGRLRQGLEMPVPVDQWGSPTSTEDVAAATKQLLERGATGTFHATGPDFMSRLDLAERVCERFDLNAGLLDPKKSGELRLMAERPLRVRLDCRKIRSLGIGAFRPLEEGIDRLKDWYLAHAPG